MMNSRQRGVNFSKTNKQFQDKFLHRRHEEKKRPIEFASIKHEIQMKPLPVPPPACGRDARAQIAARAAFRHIFTRRGAYSTRFSWSLYLSVSLYFSLFLFLHSPPLSFPIYLALSFAHPLFKSLSRRSIVDHSPSGRRQARPSCLENHAPSRCCCCRRRCRYH